MPSFKSRGAGRPAAGSLPVFIAAVLLLFCSTAVKAQGERPSTERGFHPGHSYAVSDIESISMASGNLTLNVPLGGLPQGRGGSPGFQLGLVYNSKLYDTHIEQVPNNIGVMENLLYLNDSADGGWQYTYPTGYRMRLVSRRNEEPMPGCSAGSYQYQRNAYIWKMTVIYPDGSEHIFRPWGYSDHFDDNYFAISANGWGFWASSSGGGTPCSGTFGSELSTTTPMLYYSTDGSYTRLVVEHDSSPANQGGHDNPWTLYFPDGRRITNRPAEPQRMYDRNDNYVEMHYTTHNSNPARKIVDGYGRQIIVEQVNETDPATGLPKHDHDFVYVPGVGGELLKWRVEWKTVEVVKQYLSPAQAGERERGNSYLTPLHMDYRAVSRIVLPTQAGGSAYSFGYNAPESSGGATTYGWGELSSVTLPSGAKATYAWALDGVSGVVSQRFPEPRNVMNNKPKRKELTYRPEYDQTAAAVNTPCDASAEPCVTDVWSYPESEDTISTINADLPTAVGPDGGVSQEAVYNIRVDPFNPYAGRPYRSTSTDGTTVERVWAQNRPASLSGRSVNPVVKTEFTSVKNAAGNYARTAIRDYTYDENGNPTEVREYGWVNYADIRDPVSGALRIPPGAGLLRVTKNEYWCGPNSYWHRTAPRLLNALKATEVGDGAAVLTRTEFFYDDALKTGNLTEQRTWDSTKGPLRAPDAGGSKLDAANSVSVRHEYDPNVLGKRLRTYDANGNRVEFIYDPVTGPQGEQTTDLYPTQSVTGFGTAMQRTSKSEYDFSTGLVTRMTDVDNNVSSRVDFDALGRPVLAVTAEGKTETLADGTVRSLETHQRTAYVDSARRVVSRSDRDATGDGKLVSVTHFDQLGRPRLSRELEVANPTEAMLADELVGIKVQTRYLADPSSRSTYKLVSNPYRAATTQTAGDESTMGWTRVKLFADSRDSETATFGGAALPAPFTAAGANAAQTGVAVFANDAEKIVITDQAGRQKLSVSDALGRLVQVFEAPDSANHETSYTYDALGNLKRVEQDQQARTFNYSSLSRLTSAASPEGGAAEYRYDAGGNLILKIDPRPRPGAATLPNCAIPYDGGQIATCYGYDALGRLKLRQYNDGTPAVTYTYDASGANSKGRLSSVTSSVSTYTYTAYDALGRVRGSSQKVGDVTYSMPDYVYDLAGHLVSEQYPSGRVVKTEYDAAGRIAGVKNKSTGLYYAGGGAESAERIRYAFGLAPSAVKLGNGLWEHTDFNSRLQPTQIGLGTNADNSSVLRLDYTYGLLAAGGTLDTAKNNGNPQSQSITAPGAPTPFVQTYVYDDLNRLKSAEEKAGAASTWKQVYSYDRFGNRNFAVGTTSPDYAGAPLDQATGLPRDPVQNPVIDTADNRIKSTAEGQGDYRYDEAGNLLCEPGRVCVQGQAGLAPYYGYDAANQMRSVGGGYEAGGISYAYDGDGRRVKKSAFNGETTVFIYNASGKLVAEYSNQSENRGTRYLTHDYLGSTRVVTDEGGLVKSRHDYLPFGEEMSAGKTQVPGYEQPDSTRQRFVGYQRDEGTDLDFAQARYFKPKHGRFVSVDPYNIILEKEKAGGEKGEKLFVNYVSQPQNWNRYVYVWNNPLKNVDPNGEEVYVVMYTTGNGAGDDEFRRAAETYAEAIRKSASFDPKKDTVLVMGVRTKEDVDNVFLIAKIMGQGEKGQPAYGKIQQVAIFSHAGPQGPVFHPAGTGPAPGQGIQWNLREVKNLSINWAPGASAHFYGCYTATFAQTFANIHNVTAFGNEKYAYFSSDPTKRVGPNSTGPLYLFQTDGYENGSYMKYFRGNSERYPMVRKEPQR